MEEEKKDNKIKPLEGGKSINGLIAETNLLDGKFGDTIKDPIDKKRAEVMKITMFTKKAGEATPGANITHAFIGSILAMIASVPDLTVAELKKNISF